MYSSGNNSFTQTAQNSAVGTPADGESINKKVPASPINITWGVMIASLTMILVVIYGPFASGVTENQSSQNEVNLREVLPGLVPLGLSSDNFQSLGKNWQEWATGVAGLIEELYVGENVTPQRQQAILATLKMKLKTIETAIADPRYSMIHDPLTEIHGKLSRRIMLADAMLGTLQADGQAELNRRLKTAANYADEQLDSLKKYLRKIKQGDKWIDYLNIKEIEQALKSGTPEKNSVELIASTVELINPYEISGQEQKDFVSQPVFSNFSNALADYKNLLSISFNPNAKAEQIKQLKDFSTLLEEYEELPLDEKSAELRTQLRLMSKNTPDAGEKIWAAIQKNYFNYNFRVVASENFLTRMGNKNMQECGPVHDCILGARVSGNQITNTNLKVDFKPSDNTAKFVFNLSGNTQSNTRGVTDQATVFTQGNHFFNVTRGVEYDGNKFLLDKGNIWVDANNNIYNARVNHRGLLTWLFHLDDVALERARELRGQTEAIAASRLRDKVFPRFNQELEEAFGKANTELDTKVFQPLRELEIYPDLLTYQTTEQSLLINARLMGDAELAADRPSPVEAESNGATVYIHQSWMNNAIDRMNLAGRTLSQAELKQEMEAKFSKMLNREVKFKKQPPEDKEETKFAFAGQDPIRLTVENGTITLFLSTGLKRKDKEDIPVQRISIPLKFTMSGEKILVDRGDVAVEPLERPKSVTEQIARAGVMRNKIQESIEPGELKRKFTLKTDEKNLDMEVSNLKLLNGWLVLSVK
jgi:hypothetical protein